MSSNITMDVLMQDDHFNHVAGAPDANAGEIINVLFGVGARLVASGYAVAAPDDIPEQEIVEFDREGE